MRTTIPLLLLALVALPAPAGPPVPGGRAAGGCAGTALERRVFPVRFHSMAEAALLLDQLVGPCGAWKVSRPLRVVTVDDTRENLDRIGQALASWDVPPRTVEITVSLVLATMDPPSGEGVLAELRGVSRTLADVMRWSHFERLGSVTLRVSEGGRAEAVVGEDWQVVFRVAAVDPDQEVIRLEPFELFRLPAPREAAAGVAEPRRVLGWTLNLPEGRMNLVGAPSRGRDRALFVAIEAWSLDTAAPGGE